MPGLNSRGRQEHLATTSSRQVEKAGKRGKTEEPWFSNVDDPTKGGG
jgi:hypothetical protein